MQKKSFTLGKSGILGIILLFTGIGILGFTAKKQIEHENSPYSISDILPTEGLELFIIRSEGFSSIETVFFLNNTPVSLPENGVVAAYKIENQTHFITATKKEKSQQKKNEHCEKVKKVFICAADKKAIFHITDSISKESTPLSLSQEFQDSMKKSTEDSPIRFFGNSSFFFSSLVEQIKPIINEEVFTNLNPIVSITPEQFPYFSGSIDSENAREIFFLSAKEKKFFPKKISQFDIAPEFFGDTLSGYIYLKRTDFFWNILFKALVQKDLSESFIIQSYLELKTKEIFEDDLTFTKDILPLLGSDITLLQTKNAKGIFFSLPNADIAFSIQQKISNALKKQVAKNSTKKVSHTSVSGETIYEIFPNMENVSLKKKEKKNSQFLLFHSVNPETKQIKQIGSIQKGSYLLISEDTQLLENFWNLPKTSSAFSIPNSSEEIFTSFGYKWQEQSNALLKKIEGKGVEKENGIYFYMQIEKNEKYSPLKKVKQEKGPEEENESAKE